MYDLIPVLSAVLPIIATSLLLIVIFINIYFKIRRKFPISVNCWFCNSWSKVPYDDRNSFDCPTCSQYNGFTRDGDYNKIILEQHDELMNQSTRMKNQKSTVSNGLCVLCNNNQQLKIFQLANFVPLVEENYDVEIEHFEKQLEKAYKLCRKCDRVLKNTLNNQNAWIFGNRIKNMCSNGVSKIADQIRRESKMPIFTLIDGILSVFLVLGVVFTTMSSIKFLTKSLTPYVPASYLPIFQNFISILNTSKIVEFSVAPYFTKSIKVDVYSTLCGIGLTSRLIKTLGGTHITPTKVNNLLCWIILVLISWVRYNKKFSSYILFVEAFCCVYLLATAFAKDDKKQSPKPPKSMRKLVKNLECTYTDFSDISDFENVSSSSTNSKDFSGYLNASADVPRKLSTAENIFNTSFVSAKSTVTCDADLNKSLNNLHLGLGFKSPKCAPSVASFATKRPKRVLSPPKFETVNSWVAGGFWRNGDGIVMPIAQRTNLSRSSSESSGFGSQHNELVPPKSNYFTDYDKYCMNTEFSRFSPSPTFTFPQDRRVFYPDIQQNNMLMQRIASPSLFKFNEPYHRIENWSDKINLQAMQGFGDLRLNSN